MVGLCHWPFLVGAGSTLTETGYFGAGGLGGSSFGGKL